jgi:hypothetical protein
MNLDALISKIKCDTNSRIMESVRRKIPELVPGKFILHHGNGPRQNALKLLEFLATKFITKSNHIP